ncbi:hypothetical protein POM88_038712 [Heracleum sosnowskyi]|uniref:Uncharacterized protein n=1 Tax=Heracleum sosnowskyi TaxID=360622 RepID=A0AAD8M757_9APIA|nr:hypothetical protein POM88_038712 [Heracleum sosnowskyi]
MKVWQLRVLHFPRPFLIVLSHQSTLPENFNNVREVSATQRKKGTKSGKAKNKLENPLPGSNSLLQVSKQRDSDKAFFESGYIKASQSEVDSGCFQAVKEDVEQLPKQDSLGADEAGRKLEQHSIAVTTKNDSLGRNSVKSKRASGERASPTGNHPVSVGTVNMQEHMEDRSIVVQQNHHMGSSSNSSKNIHKFMDQQGSIPEPIVSDAWDPSVGWNMPH